MRILFFPLLLLAANSLAQTSYVAPTRILGHKAYQIGISGDYFSSSKRIDNKGKKTPFTNGEGFNRLQGEFSGQYGLTENFQIGGGVRGRQNRFTSLKAATGKTETETSTGVESTFLSLMYAFKPVNQLQYVLEGVFRYRPYANEESTVASPGSLILGDDGNEISGGFGVTYNSQNSNFLTARAGYRKPGENLSDEIYWQIEGALTWKYVALIAGVDGVSSMKNDAYENDLVNRPTFNTGSTALYNGINREWLAPYGGLNFAMGPNWRVELKGSQVVSGRSTDLGTSFGASLIRRVDDQKAKIDKKFKEYDFEATVTKVSPKKGFVVIDKGLSEDIRKGMKIDFFEFDYVGGNILLASGTVFESKASSAIVKITHIFNTKKEFKAGILARGAFR